MAIPDRGLLDWLDEASAERGLYYANRDGDWDFWSYGDLRSLVLRTASALRAHGVGPGDAVALVQRSSPGFVAGFFGALAAGATPCSIAPPFAFQRADEYATHAAHLLATVRPRAVVCDDESLERIRKISADAGLGEPVVFDELVAGAEPLAAPLPLPETALIQFTSGSSGFSRGVRISNEALATNISGMGAWLGCAPEYPAASWLPVHHDMGLVGFLLNVVVTGFDGFMFQPDDFIRSPLNYLRCLSDRRIVMTAMPNFGLSYILRRVRPADLDGLSFDAMRAVIIGAERVDPRVLDDFHALLGPHGLDRGALVPAYGSAEATLAVTGLPPGEGWTTGRPDAGHAASLAGTEVVGCGRPLAGRTVTVVDEDGEALPDGQVGEIIVKGVSLTSGYVGDAGSASGTSIGESGLHTGDAGFLREGQLFVIGRLGDGLKVSGKMVFAESLETLLHQRGIPERRVAVLLGVRDGTPTGVALFAGGRPEWRGIAHEVLAEWLGDAELLSIEVPRGGIAVTSSGKPRRRVLWQEMCAGSFPAEPRPLTAD
ncbi:AMP-dependent synthetase and ligase [Streptomyces davaonensis JCM 4913]|uniref:AMP-dependent synthetase and ligase n=1 Tax=Streptomyces davaonensis (strain DSM 101723 / JCM 4913 / KCC S-0913 / 768) TaxID=1214101 RepID=K4RAK8_STRDJ|nr:AMP-binding protein [Streptomyces davaonensis]CCK30423.1 AMP-dependent synthetase and ligase [Streptomyces davaonensis JCM 4913]